MGPHLELSIKNQCSIFLGFGGRLGPAGEDEGERAEGTEHAWNDRLPKSKLRREGSSLGYRGEIEEEKVE